MMKKIISFVALILFSFEFLLIWLFEINHDLLFYVNAQEMDFMRSLFGLNSFLALITVFFFVLAPLFFWRLLGKSRKRSARIFFAIFLVILDLAFHVEILLRAYQILIGYSFDFSFVWLNRDAALETIHNLYGGIIIFGGIFFGLSMVLWWFCFSFLFGVVRNVRFPHKRIIVRGVGVIVLTAVIFLPKQYGLAFFEQVKVFASQENEAKILYEHNFLQSLDVYRKTPFAWSDQKNLEKTGDHIFILQLESVGSFMVNEKTMPVILEKAKQGVYFPKFSSNSVQTVRAQENILCGIPPTPRQRLTGVLSDAERGELPCLPSILRKEGYKTFFFKDHELAFHDTGKLMKGAGFDELHAGDIMKEGDPKYEWGYREDVFFDRVFEYLRPFADQKTLVYIAVSAANHAPYHFENDARFLNSVPYPNPMSRTERVSDSMFLQDAYTKTFFDHFEREYANSTLLLMPDNAWPYPKHTEHIQNEAGGYEENFLIPFVFFPPNNLKQNYAVGTVVEERFSQSDILPTLLDIMGGSADYPWVGKSFAPVLRGEKNVSEHEIISVQPFHGGFLSIVQYPKKYLFDLGSDEVLEFDLKNDPNEIQPLFVSSDQKKYSPLLENYFAPVFRN